MNIRRSGDGQLTLDEDSGRPPNDLPGAVAGLSRAVEVDNIGFAIWNADRELHWANEAFLKWAGYSAEETRLRLVRRNTIIAPEWLGVVARAEAELQANIPVKPYEIVMLTRQGERRWVLVSAVKLDAAESLEAYIDISAGKAADDELRRSQEHFEELLIERTAEIDAANGALRDEVLERQQVIAHRQSVTERFVAAQEYERLRISRELHDVVGQHLTALMLGMKTLEEKIVTAPAKAEFDSLRVLIEAIGKEIHDIAIELRPTALDDLGLLRAVTSFVENWTARTLIPVDFHTSGLEGRRLAADVETTIYRIICEAFNNVCKHARARRVGLILERRRGEVQAIVEDDGCGFLTGEGNADGRRLGLLGMRERAALAHARLTIESSLGKGTTVFLSVPVET